MLSKIRYFDSLARIAGMWDGRMYPYWPWSPEHPEVHRLARILGWIQ